MAKVKFFAVDLKATYAALTTKDAFALYWIDETQELYKGDVLYGTGAMATADLAGLMSAEDKAKLDSLTDVSSVIHFLGVSTTDPAEGVITIDGEVIEPVAGDIVLYGTKEFICDQNGNFVEFGDEGLYITKADAEVVHEEINERIDTLEEGLNLVDLKDIAWGKNDANGTKFEIRSAVEGFLVDEAQNDLRVFIPKDSTYSLQNVGEGGDSQSFYMTVRAWAPRADVTACRKGDYSHYERDFTELETVKVDEESGRVYADFWLPIAHTDDGGTTWTEYGDNSTDGRYIGWNWLVEWYIDDALVACGSKRINLVNTREMFYNNKDWYIPELEAELEAATSQLQEVTQQLEDAQAAITWESL